MGYDSLPFHTWEFHLTFCGNPVLMAADQETVEADFERLSKRPGYTVWSTTFNGNVIKMVGEPTATENKIRDGICGHKTPFCECFVFCNNEAIRLFVNRNNYITDEDARADAMISTIDAIHEAERLIDELHRTFGIDIDWYVVQGVPRRFIGLSNITHDELVSITGARKYERQDFLNGYADYYICKDGHDYSIQYNTRKGNAT